MRKTLYTLAFAAVTALGANAATIAPIYSWDWSSGTAEISAEGWGNPNCHYTEGDTYATISTGNPWNNNITQITGSFTVSLDLGHLNTELKNWQNVMALYSNNEKSGTGHSIQIQFNSNGELYLYCKNFGEVGEVNINTGITSADLMSDSWTNLCLISDIENKTLSVYVNGEETGSKAWEPTSPALTGAIFGGLFGEGQGHDLGSGTSLGVNNIKFYNQVVLPVPEPATASLSLLGLATLMMRRRRA